MGTDSRRIERSPRVQARTVGDEVIALDGTTNEVRCLTGASAELWLALAEPAALADLQTRFSAGVVDALLELDLLQVAGTTRRSALKRMVLVGAGAVAAAGVSGVVAPTAAAAASATQNVLTGHVAPRSGATTNYVDTITSVGTATPTGTVLFTAAPNDGNVNGQGYASTSGTGNTASAFRGLVFAAGAVGKTYTITATYAPSNSATAASTSTLTVVVAP